MSRFDWARTEGKSSATLARAPEARARLRIVDPLTLTPETHDRIVEIVRRGNYISTAGAAAGIREDTLRRWLLRGNQEEEGACKRLVDAIHQASAESEIKDLGHVSKGIEDIKNKDGRIIKYGDPKWAAWKLERTRPEKYGQKITINAKNAAADYMLDMLREGMSSEGFEEVIKILEEAGEK